MSDFELGKVGIWLAWLRFGVYIVKEGGTLAVFYRFGVQFCLRDLFAGLGLDFCHTSILDRSVHLLLILLFLPLTGITFVP